MNKKINEKIIYLTLFGAKIASIASMAYQESFTGALIDALTQKQLIGALKQLNNFSTEHQF